MRSLFTRLGSRPRTREDTLGLDRTATSRLDAPDLACNLARFVGVVPTRQIQPHPENPRRSTLGPLQESIGELGFYGTCAS